MVSSLNLNRQLSQAFNNTLPAAALKSLSQKISISAPNPGEPFWSSSSQTPGIYLILEGKVRLLDRQDNLVASLSAGTVFGQISLFPLEKLQEHRVRASWGLKLGYLSQANLRKYLVPESAFSQHLYKQALAWDLLLLCNRQTNSDRQAVQNLLKVLPQLQRHQLATGELPTAILQQRLLVLRQGTIIHSSGLRLSPGQIYQVAELPQTGAWLVDRAVEIYTLARDIAPEVSNDVQSAVQIVPVQSQPIQPRFRPRKVVASASRQQKLYFPSPKVKISHWWQQLTKQYPFRRQHSGSDCGVACLVMIGEYWGKNFSITDLRSIANVDRSGASIRGLIFAAEHLGFAPRPVKADLPTLARQKLPAIVHWRGNHYIVVYRVTRTKVIVADPKIGRRTLTHEEFNREWNGYTLLLTPTAKFKSAPEADRDIWKYFALIKPHWLVLLEVIAASLILQLIGLLTPIFTQLLFDRVVTQRSTSTLIAIGSGMIVFSLFGVAMSSLRRYLLYHTANKLDLSLVVGFITHTLDLPLSYFENRYVGDITSRISENRKIRSFITGDAISTLLDVLSVFVYIGLMFWYSWTLSLMALAVIPVYAISTLVFTPFLLKMSRESFTARTKEGRYLIQALEGIGTIKSMGVERNVRWRWEDLINESVRINFSGKMLAERLQISTGTLQSLISQLTQLFGVWLVIQNRLTIGQLIAFNMLVGNVVSPFQRLITLWSQFQEILVAVERLDDVINYPVEQDLASGNLTHLPRIEGHIRFEEVTFRYNIESEVNTIENLSFEIKPGQTVALVGRSGSGKTTISKLLLGLYQPTQGKIFVDDRDLQHVALHSLRKQTGVVDQNTFLFGGTIKENLTIAYPQATLSELERACQLAGAAEFIEQMPLRYETQIGEGGGLLSGGQRQRLAIARALLGRPRLLVLDEATSNLDAESEKVIQNNLETILNSQTTLVIAHRLSTVRRADLILVMDRGVLIEQGTHVELMAKQGQYYYLNQQQLTLSS